MITPHQTTLLKLVDSYLQSTSPFAPVHAELAPLLSTLFLKLSVYANEAIRKSLALGSTDLEDPTEHIPPSGIVVDVMLPKVCEALVLVTQCIVSIILKGQEEKDSKSGWMDDSDGKGKESGWIEDEAEKSSQIDDNNGGWGSRDDLRHVMNEARDSCGVGLVEILIGGLIYLISAWFSLNFINGCRAPEAS